ncbi:hypothetical protein FRC07_012152 [Ceratobasidium sp. 392]|nr:hypothetical protein FRC07_012152 [Ceratobasidium sp. 392]
MNASRAGDRWAVGLAPRAVKELEKLKRDRIPLDIVWKKIKELSSAQFTSDNYTAIIGTVPNIPIYRARLSSDLRIIYFIDVVPDRAKEVCCNEDFVGLADTETGFSLIVKVLRIDSRAHIDYDFWKQVSSYLYRKNKSSEYRDRCVV